MFLKDICKNIASNKLGKPGTIVECMVESIFPHSEYYGLVGKTYEVIGTTFSNGLQLKETKSGAIATRFRIYSKEH